MWPLSSSAGLCDGTEERDFSVTKHSKALSNNVFDFAVQWYPVRFSQLESFCKIQHAAHEMVNASPLFQGGKYYALDV